MRTDFNLAFPGNSPCGRAHIVELDHSANTGGGAGLKRPKAIKTIDIIGNAIVVRFEEKIAGENCILDQNLTDEGTVWDHPDTSGRLKNYILDYAKTEGKTKIILDLRNIYFVAEAGIGFLHGLHKATIEQGKKLVLCGVDKVHGLQEKLETTKLIQNFTICPDEQTALEA